MLITSLRTEKYSLKKYIQDISFIIDDAVGNYSQKAIEKDIAIIKEIKSESLELFIDSELIQKVVEILLDNAVKFSPKNSEIHVRYLNRKSKFILEVEDNGIGFSPKTLERVFNIFTSDEIMNHSEGVGLGLAVAKIIMDTHQSDIQVYNKVEGGAIVKLIFNKNSSVLEEK
jgi:K+-sensing histidine kinase KdpD